MRAAPQAAASGVRFWLRLRKVGDAVSWIEPLTSSRADRDRALEALVVEPQPGVGDAGLRRDAAHHLFGVGHARAPPCGLTKDTIWMWSRPVLASASINSILRAVGIGPFSIWKPSRGPSSLMCTDFGRSLIVHPLCQSAMIPRSRKPSMSTSARPSSPRISAVCSPTAGACRRKPRSWCRSRPAGAGCGLARR